MIGQSSANANERDHETELAASADGVTAGVREGRRAERHVKQRLDHHGFAPLRTWSAATVQSSRNLMRAVQSAGSSRGFVMEIVISAARPATGSPCPY